MASKGVPSRKVRASKPKSCKAKQSLSPTLYPTPTQAPGAGEEGRATWSDSGTLGCSGSRPPKQKDKHGSDEKEGLLVNLAELMPFISCFICKGYLIDATTITECLHTFCKSCIVKHLYHSNRCPKCNIEVHQAKPHYNLRLDPQLQNIVYKLVSGLEEKEKKQRCDFDKEAFKPAVPQLDPSSQGETEVDMSTTGVHGR